MARQARLHRGVLHDEAYGLFRGEIEESLLDYEAARLQLLYDDMVNVLAAGLAEQRCSLRPLRAHLPKADL